MSNLLVKKAEKVLGEQLNGKFAILGFIVEIGTNITTHQNIKG